MPASTHKPIVRSLKYIGSPENTCGFDTTMTLYKLMMMLHHLLQYHVQFWPFSHSTSQELRDKQRDGVSYLHRVPE